MAEEALRSTYLRDFCDLPRLSAFQSLPALFLFSLTIRSLTRILRARPKTGGIRP